MGTEKNLQIGIFVADIILLVGSVVGFYGLMCTVSPTTVKGIESLPWLLLIYLASFSISSFFFPSIVQLRIVKGEAVVQRVLTTCLIMLLLVSLATFTLRPHTYFPRSFFFYSIAIYAILLLIERFTIRQILMHMRTNKRNQKKVVLVGNDKTIHQLFDILSTPFYGYDIVGTFYDGDCENKDLAQKRLGGSKDFFEWLVTHSDINEIYGYFPKEQQNIIGMTSKFCDNHLIRFYYIPAIDVFKGNMTFSTMGGIPIIARRKEPLRDTSNRFIKRLFDLAFSTLVLVCVFPWVWIWVAIMIKIQSPGPVFFKQDRSGLDGKIFKCFKFRSMKVNKAADELQATKDDPRKFPFGDFMRKTNIDELPQFINVFKGDMSVVGPRPHMLKHTKQYGKIIDSFMVRHLAKPGITGLAQVTGFRGETRAIEEMEGRVKKDIEYIENWSFLLDLKIIIKTVTNMFGEEKGNAY